MYFPQLNSSAGVCVFRIYEDFDWLQQSLFSQENLPGLQGIIVSEFSKTHYYHHCLFNFKSIVSMNEEDTQMR